MGSHCPASCPALAATVACSCGAELPAVCRPPLHAVLLAALPPKHCRSGRRRAPPIVRGLRQRSLGAGLIQRTPLLADSRLQAPVLRHELGALPFVLQSQAPPSDLGGAACGVVRFQSAPQWELQGVEGWQGRHAGVKLWSSCGGAGRGSCGVVPRCR